jgi:hypothetical protein
MVGPLPLERRANQQGVFPHAPTPVGFSGRGGLTDGTEERADRSSAPPRSSTRKGIQMNPLRRTAFVAGWLWIITFVTSIPAYFILYAPVRDDPGLITGAGTDPTTSVALGAVLELVLIIANVGTAVVFFPILKRQNEAGALGYVGARIVECIFIAIGIISLLTFLFMRQEHTAGTDAALGDAFVAIYDRAFLIGPGFFAGFGNGLLLGWLMYRSGLVPRGMAVLGLIGGPLIMASGIAIMLDLTERGSALQGIATIPEFFWELSLGIYLIVKGFKPSPITAGLESTAAATTE